MSLGNRGKSLEADIKAYLDERRLKKEFNYHRFPDARTCGKGVGKQPADYLIMQRGMADVLLDPKELKGSMRLNIKSRCTQLPKMNRWAMTGAAAYFLVHQTDENLYFLVSRTKVNEAKKRGEKSIDLKKYKPVTLDWAMGVICLNPSD
jgi:penicillin-binding protein-related factor A (putative recombinase)